MKDQRYVSWRRRGIVVLTLAVVLLLAVWAPVPAQWQLIVRLALLAGLYLALVVHIWRDAVRFLDCNDPHLSPYCQEHLRRHLEQQEARRRTAPLTPVQRGYLAFFARRHAAAQEERRD